MSAFDVQVFRFLNHALSSGPWFWGFVFLSIVGGGWGALSIIPLSFSKRMRPHLPALCVVLVANALTVYALKRMVARERPHFDDLRKIFLHRPTDFSFPSGHSAGSFAFCVFLAIVLVRTAEPGEERRRAVLAAVLVLCAFCIGLSRIALGVHFPGDVLGGALLGTSFAAIGAQIHLERLHRRT